MNSNNKRKNRRIDISNEATITFLGVRGEMEVSVKDISSSGMRVIISGRVVGAGASLGVKLRINDRQIACKGKVTWALPLRPGLGNISVFDVGVDFIGLKPEDREFLEKFIEDKPNASDL
jgi:hypothetical protein